jgi:hypothetical protein
VTTTLAELLFKSTIGHLLDAVETGATVVGELLSKKMSQAADSPHDK